MSQAEAPDRNIRSTLFVWIAGAGILLTALNLRAAVTSVGSLMVDLRVATGMSPSTAGILTTLPPICFGVFGLLAGRLGRRYGPLPTVAWATAIIAAGLALRVVTDNPRVFIAFTVVGLASMAAGNVLLPVLVKKWFPHQIGRATGLYSLVMGLGTAIPAAVSVPIAQATGSWRIGLGIWAVPAIVAVIPWLWLARITRRAEQDALRDGKLVSALLEPVQKVGRSIQAWALAGFFGLQSLGAYVLMGWLPTIYRDAGVPASQAGLMLALVVLLSGVMAVVLPELAGRRSDQRRLVILVVVATTSGYLGLLLAPALLPWVWATLIGIGMGAFPLALFLIGLRTRTADGTSRLSSLAQGTGYLIAAGGPVLIGGLHAMTGAWTVPLVVMLALLVPMFVCGLIAARPGYVDAT